MPAPSAIAAVAAALVGVPAAGACSCVNADPRDQYADADAAILGEVVGREIGSGSTVRHTIRVTRAFKGAAGAEVVLRADLASSCTDDYGVGEKVSPLLHRSRGRWTTFACDHLSPEQMERASRPLPRPNGRPPARFLLGGSPGPARTIALDGAGRTLAYGLRDGSTFELAGRFGAACAAEHATVDRGRSGSARDVENLARPHGRLLEPVPFFDPPDGLARVACITLDRQLPECVSRPDDVTLLRSGPARRARGQERERDQRDQDRQHQLRPLYEHMFV